MNNDIEITLCQNWLEEMSLTSAVAKSACVGARLLIRMAGCSMRRYTRIGGRSRSLPQVRVQIETGYFWASRICTKLERK